MLRYSITSGKVLYTSLKTKTHGKLPDVEFSKCTWQQLSLCTITMLNNVQCQVYLNMHVLGAGCTNLLTRWLVAIIMTDLLLQFYFFSILKFFKRKEQAYKFTMLSVCVHFMCSLYNLTLQLLNHSPPFMEFPPEHHTF